MKEIKLPIYMSKGSITATIEETAITFVDASNGSVKVERIRRHRPTLQKCIEGHVRCLQLRGFE